VVSPFSGFDKFAGEIREVAQDQAQKIKGGEIMATAIVV
jgi:hypothetical protein